MLFSRNTQINQQLLKLPLTLIFVFLFQKEMIGWYVLFSTLVTGYKLYVNFECIPIRFLSQQQ